MAFAIVIVHSMPVFEVIVDHFRILEGGCLPDATFLPLSSCLLAALPVIGPIGGHQ